MIWFITGAIVGSGVATAGIIYALQRYLTRGS